MRHPAEKLACLVLCPVLCVKTTSQLEIDILQNIPIDICTEK